MNLKLLNGIIREAIYHGGDSGGPYFCNGEKLKIALHDFINDSKLSEIYTVSNNTNDFIQIIKKD